MTDPYRYVCPVCGSELSSTNFLTRDSEYTCPVCATRQKPRTVRIGTDQVAGDIRPLPPAS